MKNFKFQISNLKILLFCLLLTVVGWAVPTVYAETKEFELTVTDGEVELNGTKFAVWKYNNMFPGPEIRVKEGDIVTVKILNKSSVNHGFFFHGLHVGARVSEQEQKIVIEPGYEYTYGPFAAKPSGTHLYHCSYNMAEHLSRGMFGSFVVEAQNEAKFDKELVYILSDWNSKDAKGGVTHGTGHPMSIMDNDVYTINNKVITKDTPLVIDVQKGERVKVRIGNIGHLPHKLTSNKDFIITHEDGYLLPEPKRQNSITIYSGKRHDIVITAAEAGKYQFYHAIDMPQGIMEKLNEQGGLGHKH